MYSKEPKKSEVDFTQLKSLQHNLFSTKDYLIKSGKRPEIEITSMPDFSEKIWGLQKGELCIIGGRPSNGKSSLALQIAKDVAEHNKVLFISLEMSIESCIKRLFCNLMQVDNMDLRKRGFEPYAREWGQFEEGVKNYRLVISRYIGKTWKEISEILNNLSDKPDLIVLDYIQCLSETGVKKMEVIDEYVRNFRNMAIDHNFAGLIVSQINRSNVKDNDGEPTLSGLKYSGFLEESADKAILTHWAHHSDAEEPKDRFKIILAKNKEGETGVHYIKTLPEYSRFEDFVKPPVQATWGKEENG